MISSRRRIYGDDHEAFRDSVRRFIATEVAPNLDEWRPANGVPRSIVAAAGESGTPMWRVAPSRGVPLRLPAGGEGLPPPLLPTRANRGPTLPPRRAGGSGEEGWAGDARGGGWGWPAPRRRARSTARP